MKSINQLLILSSFILLLSACGSNSSSSSSGTSSNNGKEGTANDQQGKSFTTIGVGSQTWMAENLNVDQFRNGNPITKASTWAEWQKAGQEQKPAYCYYEFKDENGAKYGKLYNWFAVKSESGLAPEGWKIQTEADWDQLQKELCETAGSAMKSTSEWNNDGNGDNSIGFNALPAGAMNPSSMNVGNATYWWTMDEKDAESTPTRFLGYWGETLDKGSYGKVNGFSVRCVKN